mmetsp:Transcript_31778/g.41999  ORF Transcript_31778/g.41999 Transcript_31778/m.41999 type:complete len:465 (-) Transcript_31778:111-1505(-)
MDSIPVHLKRKGRQNLPCMTLKITPELNSLFQLDDEGLNISFVFKTDGSACLQTGDQKHEVRVTDENPALFNIYKETSTKQSPTETCMEEIGSVHSKLIVSQTLSLEKKLEIKTKTAVAQRELRSRKAIHLTQVPEQPRKKGGQHRGSLQITSPLHLSKRLLGKKRSFPSTQQTAEDQGPQVSMVNCFGCKKLKRKCSRMLPSCDYCLKQRRDCEYPDSLKNINHASFSRSMPPSNYVELECTNLTHLGWVTRTELDKLLEPCGTVDDIFINSLDLVTPTVPERIVLLLRFSSPFEAERCVQLAKEGLSIDDKEKGKRHLEANAKFALSNTGFKKPKIHFMKGDPNLKAFAFAIPELFPSEVVDAILKVSPLISCLPGNINNSRSQLQDSFKICQAAIRASKSALQVMQLQQDALKLKLTNELEQSIPDISAAIRLAKNLSEEFDTLALRLWSTIVKKSTVQIT